MQFAPGADALSRGLFGSVASNATAWRVLDNMDEPALARLRAVRVAARRLAWARLIEIRRLALSGRPLSPCRLP
jgi:hypothetical protein